MVNNMKRKIVLTSISVCLIIFTVLVFDNVKAASDDPGTAGDPLVTKSYVDEKIMDALSDMGITGSSSSIDSDEIEELYDYIDEKISNIDITNSSSDRDDSSNVSPNSSFIVLELQNGDRLICDGGTELILRAGQAKVIPNEFGEGISDVTSGADIKGNESIAKNHLLIVPRNDGRGIEIVEHSFIMVKGDYNIR